MSAKAQTKNAEGSRIQRAAQAYHRNHLSAQTDRQRAVIYRVIKIVRQVVILNSQWAAAAASDMRLINGFEVKLL